MNRSPLTYEWIVVHASAAGVIALSALSVAAVLFWAQVRTREPLGRLLLSSFALCFATIGVKNAAVVYGALSGRYEMQIIFEAITAAMILLTSVSLVRLLLRAHL